MRHRRPEDDAAPPDGGKRSTPVTLLTGFLGAGKSTLLARLSADPPDGLRIGAVVDDIGALGFDPTLVAAADGIGVELTNGCSCCGPSGDLVAALRSQASADVVVLEASGVADPFALAVLVEADPALSLDRIVAVVDATASVDSPIVARQLDAATVVVVTHLDRVPPADRATVVDLVAAAVPGRPVASSTLADPAVAPLLPGGPTGAHPGGERGPLALGPVGLRVADPRSVTADELEVLFAVDFGRGERRSPGHASGSAALLRAKGRLVVDGQVQLVQVTPTTASLRPDPSSVADPSRAAEPIPRPSAALGVTVVATDRSAAERLARSLAAGAPVVEAVRGVR